MLVAITIDNLLLFYIFQIVLRKGLDKLQLHSQFRRGKEEGERMEKDRVVHSMCTSVQLSSLLDIHGFLRETQSSVPLD